MTDKELYDKAVDDLWSIASGTPEEIDAMTTPWIAGYRKGIDELEKEKRELLGIIQGKDKAIADLKTTILKLRNCMNCKHRDTKGHSSCKDKGIVLCSHWEMKE